jgi:hypothetical protein
MWWNEQLGAALISFFAIASLSLGSYALTKYFTKGALVLVVLTMVLEVISAIYLIRSERKGITKSGFPLISLLIYLPFTIAYWPIPYEKIVGALSFIGFHLICQYGGRVLFKK